MKLDVRSITIALSVLALILVSAPAATADDAPLMLRPVPELVPEVCYAPGTPLEAMLAQAQKAAKNRGLETSLYIPPPQEYQFDVTGRWTATATNGGGLGQGDPTTLTWSIVPDGTSIFGYNGEPTASSNLEAFLDGIYGSSATWLPLFQQIFDAWGELTGTTYIYESNDDGTAWTMVNIDPGVVGVRGDVRISGHFIDGNSNVLAYNFFPNFSDMVIDTGDNFFTNTGSNSLGLRNVLTHEHGHGLGISHVCPVQQTKLMEPFVSFAFDGVQHDDLLASQRGYGDPFEHNDSFGTAHDLGNLSNGTETTPQLSIDDNLDEDYFSFTVDSGGTLEALSVTPIGFTYLNGPQLAGGACSAGTSFNSLILHDLGFEWYDGAMSSLGLIDANGAGSVEGIGPLAITAGTYFVRVFGDTTNDAQLYELEITLSGISQNDIFTDGFESGNVSAWSSTVP